jgi:lipopolysaccharide export system protein LptA
MLKQVFNKTITATILLLATSTLQITNAQQQDAAQEILIDAERSSMDLKNKVLSYMDNVVIQQGSLEINADLVQVQKDQKTGEETYIAKGTPATFKQVLQDGTPIHLQADEVKYQPAQFTIVLTGNAQLRQEGSEVSGDTITYNFQSEQVLASSKDNDRVKTVLQPKALKKK